MSLKFIEKPVSIEAFQMTSRLAESSADWPQWLQDAYRKGWLEEGSMEAMSEIIRKETDPSKLFQITTLQGRAIVRDGDWIVRDVQGKLRSFDPDIFDQFFEPA